MHDDRMLGEVLRRLEAIEQRLGVRSERAQGGGCCGQRHEHGGGAQRYEHGGGCGSRHEHGGQHAHHHHQGHGHGHGHGCGGSQRQGCCQPSGRDERGSGQDFDEKRVIDTIVRLVGERVAHLVDQAVAARCGAPAPVEPPEQG